MSEPQDKRKFFLSSPKKGLDEERKLLLSFEKNYDVYVSAMEKFPATSATPKETCLQHLRSSEFVILLMGPYYGSVDSESGLSNTETEYEYAKDYGIPVFVFVKAKTLESWSAQDEGDERKKHESFFEKAKHEKWRVSFNDNQALQEEVKKSIEYFDRENSKKYGPLVDAQEYFRSFIGHGKLFSHDQPLVGRAPDLKTLEDFLTTDKKIAVLSGRGGIGKSKILYEFSSLAKAAEWKRILFISESRDFRDVINSIPSGKSVLVLDDAHRYESLRYLLAIFKNTDLSQRIKLVLSLRPSGRDLLDGLLSELGVDSEQVKFIPELKNLASSETDNLIKSILGKNDISLVPQIRQLSKNCTLAAVIGSKLVKERQIDPLKIRNSEEFIRIVLNRFLEDLKKQIASPLNDKLFRYLAALSPFRPSDKYFIEKTCSILSINSWELDRMIGDLEKAGFLIRRGRFVKLVPDLLSDHILYETSVSRYGHKTDFVEHAFKEYGQEYFSNLLVNFAQLEWKERAAGKSLNLLEAIWKDLKRQFKNSNNYGRTQILEKIKKVAIVQPTHVFDLIRVAVREKASTTHRIGKFTFKWTHEHVLGKLPDLLGPIALHPAYCEEACNLLWCLSKKDARDPNPNLDHPFRKLKDLASYRIYKAIKFNERIFDISKKWLKEKDAFRYKHNPLEIISEFLKKEVEHTTSDAAVFTISSYGLNYKAAEPLRNKVIDTIASLMKPNNPSTTSEALSKLVSALAYPSGSMGRVISEEAEKGYLKEQTKILDIIKLKVVDLKSPVFNFRVKDQLRWYEAHGRSADLKSKTQDIFLLIKEDYEYKLYWTIAGYHQENLVKEYEQRQKDTLDTIVASAQEFLKREKNPVTRIESILGDFSAYKFGFNPNYFLSELASQDPKLGFKLLKRIERKPSSVIGLYCSSIIWPLFKDESLRAQVKQCVQRLASLKNLSISRNIAQAYAYGGLIEEHAEKDAKIIKKLLSHQDIVIINSLCHAFGRLAEKNVALAKNLLFSIPLTHKQNISDKILGSFGHYGVKYEDLSRADVSKLFRSFIPLNIFDGQYYHVEQFLIYTANKYPDETFGFILHRYKRGIKLRLKKDDKYQPVPYLDFDKALSGLSKSPNYGKYLDKIIGLIDINKIDVFWLPKLFQDVSDGYSGEALSSLRRAIKKDGKRLKGLALLLRDAPDYFLFQNSELIADLLEVALKVSQDCFDRVKSSLFGIAVAGGTSRSIGVASEKSLSLIQKGQETAQKYQNRAIAKEFFEQISNYGEELKREELERDEELGLYE